MITADSRRLVVDHLGRDLGVLHAEGAAEAAAGVGFLGLDELEPADRAEQPAGLLLEAELAQGVAAVVVGDLVREGRAEIGDAEFVDEERGIDLGLRHAGGLADGAQPVVRALDAHRR